MNFNPTQIPQNISDESTASICLSLLARHGPRLMREGGGQLIREIDHDITERDRRKIIELYGAKKPNGRRMTWLEIERIAQRSKSTIRKILRQAGLIGRRQPLAEISP